MHSDESLQKRHRRGRKPSAGSDGRLDLATEILICIVLVISPWLFGTTEPWAVRVVNSLNYAIGALLAWKLVLRWQTPLGAPAILPEQVERGRHAWLRYVPAVGTSLLLAYTAIAAWNARAIYISGEQRFEYLSHFTWLPHSYDRATSWERFFRLLGAACFFFGLTDLLRPRRSKESSTWLSARTKRLLWVICINGTLLAVEGILQRLSKTDKLLWLVQPNLTVWGTVQFGPYAYRSNAAQLFNLIWPLALGFFLALQRELKQGFGKGPETMLVFCCGVMAVCPILTSSRLGLAVMGLLTVGCLVWVGLLNGIKRWKWTALMAACLMVVASSGLALNWKHLSRRFERLDLNGLGARGEIYENARKMADDYPVFGVGPGAFGAVYQLYRETPDQFWYAYAHDDWLEARVTFGWVGTSLIMLILVGVLLPPLFSLFSSGNGGWLGFLYLSVGGILVTACWDLPFQVYSILLYFLTVLALISTAPLNHSRK